jgi:hypothetical protein
MRKTPITSPAPSYFGQLAKSEPSLREHGSHFWLLQDPGDGSAGCIVRGHVVDHRDADDLDETTGGIISLIR